MLAVVFVLAGCGNGDDEPEVVTEWSRDDLQQQGADLIQERSGASVRLTCQESLPNDPTFLVACQGSDGQQYVFTATEDGDLDVLVNDGTPAPEDPITPESTETDAGDAG